ncbi:hypothetical protein [Mycobacteroides abscessus]|uniref:hypothetical protein n=1 Tax=Mycobacteroides abscessus TaxID=36809 RepID=UPI0013F65A3B|nr:hypothetical protein [Mycobacteroides abscessus]
MSRWNPRPPWARKTHGQRPRPSHGAGSELVAVAQPIGVVVEADWISQTLPDRRGPRLT